MRRVPTLLFLTLLITMPLELTTLPLGAQTTASGSVHGVASDQLGGVVPGVSISATSPTVPGVYRTTTDRVGRYRLADLPPGDYTVVAELAGFARFLRAPVTVRTGLNVEVDIAMKVGDVGETIQVRMETPLLETRNGAQAVNVSGDLLRGIPRTERREWFGALALAPGVIAADYADAKLFYVHGADPVATVIQIDGADVTSAARSGVSYLSLNTDTVDDIQIQTSGLDASSPLGVGGVINIASASGTNRLKGAASLFVQPRRWNGSNTPGGTSSTVDQTQVDLSLGGPIVKNHLWAFGSYRRSDITTGVSRTATQLAVLRALVSGYQPLDSDNKAHVSFAKLTAQPSASHQIVGFYQTDVNPVLAAAATTAKRSSQSTGGSAASVRLSSVWSDHLTTRLGASYNDKRRETNAARTDEPLVRIFDSTILSAGRLSGNGGLANVGSPLLSELTQPNSKLTLSLDATVFARHGSSSHEVQAGLYFQPRVQGNHLKYVNDGFNFEERVLRCPGVYDEGTVPFHRQIVNGPELTTFEQRGRDYAIYVQDAWRPTARLTLNAGVRVDHIVVRDEVFGVTSQNSTEVGPRFGINYALTSDGRSVARAHWVRVHDQPGIVTTIGNPSLGQRDLYDLDLDGTFETVFVTPPTSSATANRTNDPGLHQPSVREWGAGGSRQLRGAMTANVDFVRRRFADRPTLVEINGRYSGSVFIGYANEAFNEVYTATNNEWNTPVYSSLDLSVTKRTERLQALASYVRQWRHIDGTWQPNDPASFIQPQAFANHTGIGSSTGTASAATDANSLSGTQMTQSSTASAQWQDHVVHVGVTYTGPLALLLASSYTFQSGAWSGPIVTRVASPDPAFGPTTVRLSNGRVVTNPLATTIRFAYSTRGEGQLRTPDLHAWNLRAGRRFTSGRVKLDASLDVFNVTNNGADLGFQSGANQQYNPLFGSTTYRQLPRSAQVVLRASF
jgi:hypothetical protein